MPRLLCFNILMGHFISFLIKKTWKCRQVKSLTVVTQLVSCVWGIHLIPGMLGSSAHELSHATPLRWREGLPALSLGASGERVSMTIDSFLARVRGWRNLLDIRVGGVRLGVVAMWFDGNQCHVVHEAV